MADNPDIPDEPTLDSSMFSDQVETDAHKQLWQSTAMPLLQTGQTWGKYLIEKQLGEGGQAVVYQAFDRYGSADRVALKIARYPLATTQIQTWVNTEVEPLKKLDHSCIVKIVDAGCVDGWPYIATSLAHARPLNEYRKTNPPSLRQIVTWMLQLCDAVNTAHQAGVVHYDLKPSNILIDSSGSPLVIDFGLAQMVTAYRPDRSPSGNGTPGFMAPEQARAEVPADHRVDVFSLGATLKYLLEGTCAYRHGSVEEMSDSAKRGEVVLADDQAGPPLRRLLARIANRAMAADPNDRYQTVADMAKAVQRLARKSRFLAASVAIAVLVGAVIWGSSMWSTAATDGELAIHFQRQDQIGSYQVLTADVLPLRSGDRVQIHSRLPRQMYALLISASSSGQMAILYPAGDQTSRKVSQFQIPKGRDNWLPLEPPGGTETLILIAGDKPFKDKPAVLEQIRSLGPPPRFEAVGLLMADASGPRFDPAYAQRPVGPDPIQVDKGFLDDLLVLKNDRWPVVRVLAFPHRDEGITQETEPEND